MYNTSHDNTIGVIRYILESTTRLLSTGNWQVSFRSTVTFALRVQPRKEMLMKITLYLYLYLCLHLYLYKYAAIPILGDKTGETRLRQDWETRLGDKTGRQDWETILGDKTGR